MTSTADRLRRYEHARETWDEPTARTLVDLLPPDASQLATKADLGELRAGTKADLVEVRAEMAELRADMRADLAELRSEMHQGFSEQTRTLAMWMISTTVTCVTFSVGSVFAAAALT
jgi:hypothetical protein